MKVLLFSSCDSSARADPRPQSLSAALSGLALASLAAFAWQCVDPSPWTAGGITVDRLGALLVLVVAAIGTVTFRYAVRCLEGNPRRDRFLVLLWAAVSAAAVLVCATNLLLLLAAWVTASFAVQGLVAFARERPEAVVAARMKFASARLGDLALAAAVFLVWQGWGTLDLGELAGRMAAGGQEGRATTVSLLVCLAAMTKSAQLPFHGWLPGTVDAPTPLSAMLHAGIINAGGVLLVRFAPLISRTPEAWIALSAIGTATIALGMVTLWAQVSVKRSLAWSTVAQMGFMVVQCGLCAFPAAMLHLMGHACYKAWSFLRAGEVPPRQRKVRATPAVQLALVALGIALAAAPTWFIARAIGMDLRSSPSEAALLAVAAIACGQAFAAMLGGRRPTAGRVAAGIALVLAVGGSAPLAYAAADAFLHPALGPVSAPEGPAAWLAAAIPVAAMLLLSVLHALLPALAGRPAGRALHAHGLNGFYVAQIVQRLVDTAWRPHPHASQGQAHA